MTFSLKHVARNTLAQTASVLMKAIQQKGEAVPLPKHHDMEGFRWSGVELHTFLSWAVEEGDNQVHSQTYNSLGIITPDIHRIGGWVGPIADLDPAVAQSSYPGHFND